MPRLTLDDGVVGHRLHTPPIVVKRQVPHPGVKVLDESSLMDGDLMFQPGPGLWFTRAAMFFRDEPAAIQEFNKVILENKQRVIFFFVFM